MLWVSNKNKYVSLYASQQLWIFSHEFSNISLTKEQNWTANLLIKTSINLAFWKQNSKGFFSHITGINHWVNQRWVLERMVCWQHFISFIHFMKNILFSHYSLDRKRKLVNINNMFTNNVLNNGLSFTHVAWFISMNMIKWTFLMELNCSLVSFNDRHN